MQRSLLRICDVAILVIGAPIVAAIAALLLIAGVMWVLVIAMTLREVLQTLA